MHCYLRQRPQAYWLFGSSRLLRFWVGKGPGTKHSSLLYVGDYFCQLSSVMWCNLFEDHCYQVNLLLKEGIPTFTFSLSFFSRMFGSTYNETVLVKFCLALICYTLPANLKQFIIFVTLKDIFFLSIEWFFLCQHFFWKLHYFVCYTVRRLEFK